MENIYKLFKFLEKQRGEKSPLRLRIFFNDISVADFERELNLIVNSDLFEAKMYFAIAKSKNEQYWNIFEKILLSSKQIYWGELKHVFLKCLVVNDLWGAEKIGNFIKQHKGDYFLTAFSLESVLEKRVSDLSFGAFILFYDLFPSESFIDYLFTVRSKYSEYSDKLEHIINNLPTDIKKRNNILYRGIRQGVYYNQWEAFSVMMDKWINLGNDFLYTIIDKTSNYPEYFDHTIQKKDFFKKMFTKYKFPKDILIAFLNVMQDVVPNNKEQIEILNRKINEL